MCIYVPGREMEPSVLKPSDKDNQLPVQNSVSRKKDLILKILWQLPIFYTRIFFSDTSLASDI